MGSREILLRAQQNVYHKTQKVTTANRASELPHQTWWKRKKEKKPPCSTGASDCPTCMNTSEKRGKLSQKQVASYGDKSSTHTMSDQRQAGMQQQKCLQNRIPIINYYTRKNDRQRDPSLSDTELTLMHQLLCCGDGGGQHPPITHRFRSSSRDAPLPQGAFDIIPGDLAKRCTLPAGSAAVCNTLVVAVFSFLYQSRQVLLQNHKVYFYYGIWFNFNIIFNLVIGPICRQNLHRQPQAVISLNV